MTGLSPAPHRKGIPGGACKDVVHDNTLETALDSSLRRPDRQQGTVENRGKGNGNIVMVCGAGLCVLALNRGVGVAPLALAVD